MNLSLLKSNRPRYALGVHPIPSHSTVLRRCAEARRTLLNVLLILAFASVSAVVLYADVTASVSGTVTDSTGAVVPNVKIELRSIETGIVRTTQTNADGFYNFLQLPPGHYDIAVHQPGFSEFLQTGLVLDVNSSPIINIKLKLGEVAQKVEIVSNAVQIDTGTTQLGDVISSNTILAVPLETRSYTDLLALQPGVAPVSSGLAGSSPGQFTSAGFAFPLVSGNLNAGNLSVNGQRESQNGFLLNGTTVQEFAFSGAAVIPNLDSIAEFRILTNNFDAEYGNYAGGQINVITKSGSNLYHGSAFEFLRNTDLDARNYFAATRDQYQQNEFGGTFGGPIKRDKLFFFADYQGDRVVLGQGGLNGQLTVPSNAERSGNFSDIASQLTGTVQGPAWAQTLGTELGKTVTQGEPYYFAGCAAANCVFPGAQIPAAAISVPSSNLLQYIPPVNGTGSNGQPVYNTSALPERINDDKTSGRLDYNSRYGLMTAYYFYDQYTQTNPNPNLPGFGSNYYGRSQVVNLGDSKNIGSTAVNEFRFGFVRLNYTLHAPTGGEGITPASLGFQEGADTLGISPSVPQYAHIPEIDFNNFSIGASGAPLGVKETTYQFLDNVSKVIGTHTIKFGGQFRYNQLVEYNLGSNGDFGFNGTETGSDFADFLIGAPSGYSQGQGYPSYGRNRYFGLFAQDSWRIKPNITLNYGLRYDIATPWWELHNELETIVPGEQSLTFPGSPTGWVFPLDPGVPRTLAPTRYDNFAPRIGLAYSPNADSGLLGKIFGGPGQSSIRVGYGKFFSTFEGATNFNEIGDAPFGNYYGSPVPPEFVTPFVDRGTGNIEGQRFPVPPPPYNASPKNPDNSIDWAQYLQISSSPGFWHKNALPYSEQYELSIERQLNRSTLLTVSYVGTEAHHLLSSLEANPGDPALCLSVSQPSEIASGSTCGPGGEGGTYYPLAGGVIDGTRPILGQDFGSNGYFITGGNSSYNSLQISVQQHIKDLTFLAGYTYGKSLDNASGYGEQINYQDPDQKQLSAFDVRHNFVISYDYRLPFYRLPGPSRLTNGWRLTGITRFSSGLPVTLTETDDRSLTGTSGPGAISQSLDTPNYNGAPLDKTNPRSGLPYFNVNDFSQETLGQFGTAGRRFFYGPGLNNFDMALLKDTQIKESLNLEFRAEAFNLFNHAQFGLPSANYASPSTFGIISTANPPRIMQLSLKLLF